jgi:hypothetical protein
LVRETPEAGAIGRISGVPMALNWDREREAIVDALAEKLDERLRRWKPDTAAAARERVTEVIELADHDILDIARSRAAEQEVLDLLDEPPTR